MTTATDMVTAIDAAILALVSGAQSYSVLGRSVTKANLKELRDTRDYYANIAMSDAGTASSRNRAALGRIG